MKILTNNKQEIYHNEYGHLERIECIDGSGVWSIANSPNYLRYDIQSSLKSNYQDIINKPSKCKCEVNQLKPYDLNKILLDNKSVGFLGMTVYPMSNGEIKLKCITQRGDLEIHLNSSGHFMIIENN